MSFEWVYRVTTKGRPVTANAVDALASDLAQPMPAGYREYVTTLGDGELCDLLQVRTPDEVLRFLHQEAWEREGQVRGLRDGWWKPCMLMPEDLELAVTFADTAEGDAFVCCPRFGPELFYLPRHCDAAAAVDNGLYGAALMSVRSMRHDFPFFEPLRDPRRRHRGFDVRSGLPAQGFITEVVRKWGSSGFRRSRISPGETHPNLFIRAIDGRMVLYLDGTGTRLPRGCFSVAMDYDIESESVVAEFVEAVRLPGGNSWVS